MNVIIIEDEELAAERIKDLLLEYDSTFNVVSRIDSVKKAVNWFSANQHPDLAIMDIQLGDGLVFKLFEKVEVLCPVIFTTAYDEYTFQAFKAYSVDYLLKPLNKEEFCNALDKFKRLYYSENSDGAIGNSSLQSEFSCISPRELEILRLMSKGKSSFEIGELLFISENTVFKHRKNMLKKMNVKNTGELISKAVSAGIV